MTGSSATKTCPRCCMEIPAGAKRCPYCQHYQTRRGVITHHPGVVILVVFAVFLGIIAVLATLFPDDEQVTNYARDITILSSDLRFGETYDGPSVAVIGRMRNDSDVDCKEIRLYVEYRDAAGTVVDIYQGKDALDFLPAHEEIYFKVSHRREFPESSYVAHTVRVITAEDTTTRF